MHEKVWCKCVRDGYKCDEDQLDRHDSSKRRMSYMGGYVGELDELLMDMGQARDEVWATRAAEKTAQRERDEEKDQLQSRLLPLQQRERIWETAQKQNKLDREEEFKGGTSASWPFYGYGAFQFEPARCGPCAN